MSDEDKRKDDAPEASEAKKPEKPKRNIKIKSTGSSALKRDTNRKWMMIGGVVVVGVVAASMLLSKPPMPIKKKVQAPPPIEIVPKTDVQQSFEKRTQTSIALMKGQIKELGEHQTSMLKTIKQMDQDSRDRQLKLDKQLQTLSSQLDKVMTGQKDQQAKSGKSNGESASSKDGSNLPPVPAKNLGALPDQPPAPPLPPGAKKAEKKVFDPNAPIILTPPKTKNDGKVPTSVHYVKNKYAGFIPQGSFAPAVLLSGVEAGTASTSQSNPQPVLMRIQNKAQLPGGARYKLESCFVTGSAFGSASTQRAYIRLVSLSCVDKRNHLVLSAPLKGYVTDSDGMFGLRGKQVQREGALLAKTMLAGFASGLGTALSGAQGVTSTTAGGAANLLSGSDAMRSSGLTGASNAANMLAKFYLDQAKNIFPVIEVPAKRKATIVISEGTSLRWHDYGSLYVKDERPTK